MRYFNTSAFLRQVSKLPPTRKDHVKKAYHQLIDFFEKKVQPPGLGIKRIRSEVWSVRMTGGDRIFFKLEKDRVIFVFAGNHDEYERFLGSL